MCALNAMNSISSPLIFYIRVDNAFPLSLHLTNTMGNEENYLRIYPNIYNPVSFPDLYEICNPLGTRVIKSFMFISSPFCKKMVYVLSRLNPETL